MLDSILTAEHYHDYKHVVGQFELLDREGEQRLALLMEAGRADGASAAVQAAGVEARETLILHNLRLVLFVAKSYRNSGVDIMEVIQEGNIGLMEAVDGFESGRQKFSTYAYLWVKQACRRAVANCGPIIHIPVGLYEATPKVRKTMERLAVKLQREPTIAEIVDETGTGELYVTTILSMQKYQPVSLDQEHRDTEGNQFTLLDVLPDVNARDLEDSAVERVLIDDLLSSLDPRSRVIIERRYGLHGHTEHTLQEVGQCINRKRQRVQQLEIAAMDTLRKVAQA